MFSIHFDDSEIKGSLTRVSRLMGQPQPTMKHVGHLMVTWIKESMDSQRGFDNRARYQPLSKQYAEKKLAAGGSPQRVLFGPSPGSAGAGGGLFRSWKIRVITDTKVEVGAAGGRLNRVKASAHDGGLAQLHNRPELNRLRLGWSDKQLKQVVDYWMDQIAEAWKGGK